MSVPECYEMAWYNSRAHHSFRDNDLILGVEIPTNATASAYQQIGEKSDFDWALGRRVTRFRLAGRGWWVNLRYYLLVAVLASSALGVLLSGLVAAIPVLTRGLVFLIGSIVTILPDHDMLTDALDRIDALLADYAS